MYIRHSHYTWYIKIKENNCKKIEVKTAKENKRKTDEDSENR